MTPTRKPDIVCIGAQKAGTSWLFENLASRPDVWVPPFKEMHFFDHKFLEECRKWAPWHVRKGLRIALERHLAENPTPDPEFLRYIERLKTPPMFNGTWYKLAFSPARDNQKSLDVTPEYSCIPETGVQFFRRFLPEAKILYIIRHPLSRLVSQLRMNVSRKKRRPETQKQWLELLQAPALLTRGDYKCHVPKWLNHYAEDQLMFLPFGTIRTDPAKFLQKVERHCELSPWRYAHQKKKIHETEPVSLPDFVTAELERLAEPQEVFLRDHFGVAFLEETK